MNKKAPYLDPDHSLGYLSRVSFRAFSRALEKMTLKHGISSGQWRFLRVLWEKDGMSQRRLSELAGTREPTTVRAIRSLEKASLITRKRDPLDARKFNIQLTAKSRKLKAKLMPYVIEVNTRAAKGISKSELEITRKVLKQMHLNLK